MDKSLLGKLPIELRLDIYERVFYVEDGLRITLDKTSSKYQGSRTKKAARRPTRSTCPQKHLLAIRAACREIYLETDGIVSAVNNSWVFVHCKDNTTAWGKRARQWLLLAGVEAQKRVQSVQFDVGVWTKQHHDVQSRMHDVPSEAIAMWHYLPKQLKQRSIDCSIRLTVDWTTGMKLLGGDRRTFGPCVYKIPMWKPRSAIKAAIKLNTRAQQDPVLALARAWRDSWALGKGEVGPFKSPPRFHKRGPRLYREVDDLFELSNALVEICGKRLKYRRVRYVRSMGCLQLVICRYTKYSDFI